MKLGYLIILVNDVVSATQFYHEAFGIETRFVHEGGDYAELETGQTTLAFATHSLGAANFPAGDSKLTELSKPAGVEIALVTDDVVGAVAKALTAGASLVAEPVSKSWGHTVAYVRSPDGSLIELCSPTGG